MSRSPGEIHLHRGKCIWEFDRLSKSEITHPDDTNLRGTLLSNYRDIFHRFYCISFIDSEDLRIVVDTWSFTDWGPQTSAVIFGEALRCRCDDSIFRKSSSSIHYRIRIPVSWLISFCDFEEARLDHHMMRIFAPEIASWELFAGAETTLCDGFPSCWNITCRVGNAWHQMM